jgi:hypothetical protein
MGGAAPVHFVGSSTVDELLFELESVLSDVDFGGGDSQP